jgi:hypothetical protein
MEQQGKMTHYSPDDQVQDMLAMVIAVGYVFLFSCAAPIIVVITLFYLMLSLRINAWKLTVVLRRPHPMRSGGIGNWNEVITLLTWMGLLVSVAFIVLACFPHRHPHEQLLIFFLIERCMIALKVVFSSFVGDQRSDTTVVERRRKYLEEQLMLHKSTHTHSHAKPKFDGELQTLTQTAALWQSVEHEADDTSKSYDFVSFRSEV